MKKVFSVVRKGWLAGILCLVLALSVVGSVRADDGELPYPIMRPDRETLLKWIESYNAAPRTHIDLEKYQVPSPQGSKDLLVDGHLQYTPLERNQGTCGNCWAWAGTGCLGIALHVEETILDRLSVQYINSCESEEIGKTCCDRGWLSDLADFYTATKKTIPWSIAQNSHWQDGGAACATTCASIVKIPYYPITSIVEEVITTQTVTQATAKANIKNVLDQDKAIFFGFFLPDNASWTDFQTFWNNDAESVIYDIDQFCDIPYDDTPGEGGGHAVLCVGYNDDVSPPYWIMLNSWGTTANRPDGLFRITMDMDYGCVNDPYYSFYWQSLDVGFSTTITFDASPADSGWITFDGPGYDDGETANKAADTYPIIAHPEPGYEFSKWQTTGGLSVADADSATTTCDVTGSGTLTTVQTATTFDKTDFSGTWNLFVVGQDDNAVTNGWVYGPINSNGDGTIAAGTTLTRPDGTDTVAAGSIYTVAANGTMTITLKVNGDTVDIKGAMSDNKDVISLVLTNETPTPDVYGGGTLIKAGNGFLPGDFDGIWSLYTSWQQDGTVTNGWIMGPIDSNGNGTIAGTTLHFEDDGTEAVTSGSYTLDTDGTFTTFSLVVGGETYNIEGAAMNNSKDVIGLVFTNTSASPNEYGGGALVKNQAGDFGKSDFKGTWRFYDVWQEDADAENGWEYGTLISDGDGTITSGTYFDEAGEFGSIPDLPVDYELNLGGFFTTPPGAVPGTPPFRSGAINDGCNVIASVFTIPGDPAEPNEYGAGVMVYPSAAAAAAAKDDGGGGVCAIATASYGTPMAEEVKALSAFRDQYLLTNKPGRTLVSAYERISPPVADFIRNKKFLKAAIRFYLTPIARAARKVTR